MFDKLSVAANHNATVLAAYWQLMRWILQDRLKIREKSMYDRDED